MSGRGRGVSNAPAWMTKQDGPDAGGGAPPMGGGERDPFGRLRHPNGGPPMRDRPRGGSPPRRYGREEWGPPRGGGGRDFPPHRRPGGPPMRRGGPRGYFVRFSFQSPMEERDWVEDRRHKRKARKSLFDAEPTPEQLAAEERRKAALAATGGTDNSLSFVHPASQAGADPMNTSVSSMPQQTRHARRLYVGHLPVDLGEDEVHTFFTHATKTAMGTLDDPKADDPVLSVYINHERRFAFVEFKSVEICTAGLALDGINVCGRGKVKVKRPNDYNPSIAPELTHKVKFDVSKLGIVGGMVADGPNKIFIGGLHYHLTDDQVMELLGAFGTIRSFHLVKADPTAMTSKGYCFVEYSDSSVTPIAVMGLNGMDMGGGKTLSARIAAGRSDMPDSFLPGTTASSNYGPPTTSAAEPTVVDGVDIQALLDAAMGGSGSMTMMPAAVAPAAAPVAAPMDPMAMYQNPGIPVMAHNPYAAPPSSLDPNAIATAALDAAFGGSAPPVHNGNHNNSAKPILTRILVLHNMVEEDDLTNDESYEELYDEVKEESAKFGKLTSMKIPRLSDGHDASAVKKIFLEYASIQDAQAAEAELAGRQFGPNIVEATYYPEDEYLAGKLK